MDDTLFDLTFRPKPTASRPLLGLTILVVEDSRFASEALRLLCLRSGARIRRADCLASAYRHLNVYRPSVAIVDLGLPDGSGLDLIAYIAGTTPRVPVILGTSGSERNAAEKAATRIGADGFIAKPMVSLASFQAEVLRHLPTEFQPAGPRKLSDDVVVPDALALQEDLAHALDLLCLEDPPMDYLKPFLTGLARAAGDEPLLECIVMLPDRLNKTDRGDLKAILSDRLVENALV
jgi:CheY-like chemotaxis protein